MTVEREYVITGAYVVSMDEEVGDLPEGQIHVRDGTIVAVEEQVIADAPQLNADGMIALPGLVDTHWHMWTTLFRSMSSTGDDTAYFPLNIRLGCVATPQDLYDGVRLALVDALSSGITTVNDWAHNLRSPEHADADLRAHHEIGLRGRFSYGAAQGTGADRTVDLADLVRVGRDWFDGSRLPLMRLGLAGRPPGLVDEPVYRKEYEAAQDLGLPVSYHANASRVHGELAMIERLGEAGMLGPATQLVHALYTSERERSMLAESGASVTISPFSELLIGYGIPPVRDMVDSNVLLTLSVDTLSLVGSADLWAVMRLTTGLYRGISERELCLPSRHVLRMATIDAARSLGLSDLVGSLTPGKRADVVLVRSDDVTTAPRTDVSNMLALATGPSNVDTVILDGVVRKRGGQLVDIDTEMVVEDAERALQGLLARDRRSRQ